MAAYKAKHFEGLKHESEYLNKNFGYESSVLNQSQLHQEIDSPHLSWLLSRQLELLIPSTELCNWFGEAAKSLVQKSLSIRKHYQLSMAKQA